MVWNLYEKDRTRPLFDIEYWEDEHNYFHVESRICSVGYTDYILSHYDIFSYSIFTKEFLADVKNFENFNFSLHEYWRYEWKGLSKEEKDTHISEHNFYYKKINEIICKFAEKWNLQINVD